MSSFLSDSFSLRQGKEKRKKAEQRKSAQESLRSFNYAKSYEAQSKDEADEEVKPMNQLGEAYLASLGDQQGPPGKGASDRRVGSGDGGEEADDVSTSSVVERMRSGKSLGSGTFAPLPPATPTDIEANEDEDDVSVLLSPQNTTDELDYLGAESSDEQGQSEFGNMLDSILHDEEEEEPTLLGDVVGAEPGLVKEEGASDAEPSTIEQPDVGGAAARDEIVALVAEVLPGEMSRVDDLLAQFQGREDKLMATLLSMKARAVAEEREEDEPVLMAPVGESSADAGPPELDDICQTESEDNVFTQGTAEEEEPYGAGASSEGSDEEKDGDRIVAFPAIAGATAAAVHGSEAPSNLIGTVYVDEESGVPTVAANTLKASSEQHSMESLEDTESGFERNRRRRRYLLFASLLLMGAIVVVVMGVGVDQGMTNIDRSTIFVMLPTKSPTSMPSISSAPSSMPSKSPSRLPSSQPSVQPSSEPTPSPSYKPSISAAPSAFPSMSPSTHPSGAPSDIPSESPSSRPSLGPSQSPSLEPSEYPSVSPTAPPSQSPSAPPTASPSDRPSASPTAFPSVSSAPSASPSASPTVSSQPSSSPSVSPTASPSDSPSAAPTVSAMPSSSPTLEIEPLRTMLKQASPSSGFELHDEGSSQYRCVENYLNFTDAERVQLWGLGCFYYETLGHQWYINTDWMSNVTVCDWYGLTCDEAGMVVELSLPDNRVRRGIPVQLEVLTSLQYLGLADNSLRELPAWLFDMDDLEVIDLDNNGIEAIPTNIPRRKRLKELYLAENGIASIPESLASLQGLEVLWLWKNEIEGTLPAFMSRMNRLSELDVEDNYLTGDLWPIPEMGKLETFFAYDNILGGEVTLQGDLESSPALDATGLKALDLSTNYYSGTIPASISSMTKMVELGLEDLELEGVIPPELFSLQGLEKLYLGENYLSSELPVELGNARSLATFRAQNNYRERKNGSVISKGLMGSIPLSIANLVRMEDLRLENNFLGGGFHSEMGQLTSLVRLRLDLNVFRGPIPSSVGNMVDLKTFSCYGNYMIGPLPNELENAASMTRIDVHDNAFTGTIPPGWGVMRNLTYLDLSYNELTGPVPYEFGNFAQLEELYVESNRLYGFMPEEVCLLTDEDNGNLVKVGANCNSYRTNTPPPSRAPIGSNPPGGRRCSDYNDEGQCEGDVDCNWWSGTCVSATATAPPSVSPQATPTTASPTQSPASEPTASPVPPPSSKPSLAPTDQASLQPSVSAGPSLFPSGRPSKTLGPSTNPTLITSSSPSESPSTPKPTLPLTEQPSKSATPSKNPTYRPTDAPTAGPTEYPTWSPTVDPTLNPTQQPTGQPSESQAPSEAPTVEYFWVCNCCTYCEIDPELHPTNKPTKKPTPPPVVSVAPSPSIAEDEDLPGTGNWWNPGK
ncbi:hypothetical protein ACHAXT_010980 [Thalassiosira profunda]